MKTKFMKVLGLAACLLGGSAFAAEGDIWEILPCDETGLIEVATPVSTFESPLPAGTNLYFKVRMIARYKQDGDKTYGQWHTKGKFSSDYDAALNPPRICLYVSGVKTYADLVGEYYHGDRNQFTDFIFKYTVKAGDFAMPMKLGTATGPADDADAGSQYYFDPKTSSAWSFVSDVEGVPVQANWWFWNGADPMERGESSPAATQDIALTKAGYYLKTVDFDNEWEEKGVLWRSVHEGSTQTIGVTPSLVAMPSVTESKTLYVWSTNEDAVVVKSDTIVHMRVGGTNLDPVYADYHVAAVTIVGDYAEFEIEGVAEDGLSGLVLCAYDHFTYSSSTGKREMDYVTVPVKCIEALPPSIEIKPENTTVVAGSNYTHYVTELSVRFTQAFSNDVTFTIKPRFESDEARTAGADWKDYIRVSDSKDISSISAATNFTFTIPAGKLIPYKGGAIEKIYLFALRSDKWTINANHLEFVAETDNEEAKAYISGFNETQGAININAMTPVILLPTEGDSSMTAVAGADRTLRIKVAGSYADMNSDAGYEIWIIKSSDIESSFTQVGGETGRYKIGQGDYLYLTNTTATLPAVQYSDTTHTPNKSIIYVKSPVSGLQSAERNFSVAVSAPAGLTITSDGKEKVSVMEGDAVGIEVTLDQPNTTGKSLFVFLAPVTEKDTNSVDCAFLAQTGGVGLEIGQYGTSVVDNFNMIDGCIGAVASTFRYKVILRDNRIFEEGNEVTSYLCKNTLTVVSTNVEPEVTYVEIDQKRTMRIPTIGGSLSTKFSVNTDLKHEFGVKVNEPGTYDKTNTNKPFKVTWTFEEYNPATGATVPYDGGMGDSITRYGNPDTLLVTNTFPYPLEEGNRVKVTVALEDKDMRDHGDEENDEFYFYLDIVDKPTITVEPLYEAEPNRYLETEAGTASFNLNLEFNECKQPIVCQVKVASGDPGATNPGAFVLKPRTSSTLGNVVAKGGGIYEVTFPARRASVNITLLSLDGTVTSASDGFVITPTMLTDTFEVPNSGGKTPKEYYLGVEQVVRVGNVAPTVEILTPSPHTNGQYTSVSVGQVQNAIIWNFTDVTNDFAKGITVSFNGGGGTNAIYYSKTDANKAGAVGFCPTFSASGDYTVDLVIRDEDSGIALTYKGLPMTWNYKVSPAKTMTLIPHGPTSGYSGMYLNNYGAGRVYAEHHNSYTITKEFAHKINCAMAKTCRVYGYGYKVGDIDGQKLHYPYTHIDGEKMGYISDRNIKIDASGNGAEEGGYSYTNRFTATDVYGKPADSFLYAWLVKNLESGATKATWAVHTYKPEGPFATDSGVEVALPTDLLDDGTYDDTTLEAVFSLEYLASDNMGDINRDGVPDAWFHEIGFEVTNTVVNVATGVSGSSAESLKDSVNVAAYNTDNDYLPVFFSNRIASLTNKPFTVFLELRGYGEHLNDAPNNNGYMSLTGYKPDRCYLDPRDAANGSTLTIAEYLAWRDYAAANGIADPDAPANWESWSPENPSDPTKDDTDSDGMSDGFEYAFWYGAKVGFYDEATSNHTYLTGRRFDPRHPGQGTLITRETIMSVMNPTKPLDAELVARLDSDNDGLPDVLEFQLGTNPFDFDSDGDGLPDGWEILAGYDPLLTGDDGRNADGDAMAITSPLLEKLVMPTPLKIDSYTTFALVDPDGDSAGVQWYATKDADTISALETLTEESVEYYVITTANGKYATTVQPFSTSENLLANDLYRENTYLLGEGDVVLMPIDVPAGTPLTEAAPTAKAPCIVKKLSEAIDKKVLNAAWVYGRDANFDASRGEVTTAGAAAGFLALGRQLAAPAGAVVCAPPSTERDVALLHYLVYQEYCFDPRTAWSPFSPLAARWNHTDEGDGVYEGLYNPIQGGYTTYSTRTRKYTAYDEFLVMSFFQNNGTLEGVKDAIPSNEYTWLTIWKKYTTNPIGPGEIVPDNTTDTDSDSRIWDDNGADTDGDGVADGWELYIMSGPKKAGAYVFAPPYGGFTTSFGGGALKSYWSPFVGEAKTTATDNQLHVSTKHTDGLTEFREFGGTDVIAYYDSFSTNMVATKTIVRHDADKNWINKFFPTDPWNGDTDGDGVKDGDEGDSFIYGSPVDNGLLWSIPGGGLNPCSVDTDRDGLPDGWEKQFKGKTVCAAEGVVHYAEGLPEKTGNPLEGLIDGMDGTVADAVTIPNAFEKQTKNDVDGVVSVVTNHYSVTINRDYDHDGLENWQEYLVGAMRCWRYDDPKSPWLAVAKEMYWTYNESTDSWVWDPKYDKLGVADEDAFWYETLMNTKGELYNPHLLTDMCAGNAEYFSRVTNVWDCAYYDTLLSGGKANGAYYIFMDRVGNKKIEDYWVGSGMSPGPLATIVKTSGSLSTPNAYISCSPIDEDTDHDGMDDYYELFHGMNPLLGESGKLIDSDGPCDIVYDAWENEGKGFEAWGTGSTENYWQQNPRMTPRGNTFDFDVFPWLNGLATADPDGDDIRNQEEAIMPKLATKTWHHTDPTPLWMTDTSYTNSLVRRFFRMPTRSTAVIPACGSQFIDPDGGVHNFLDFDDWGRTDLATTDIGFGKFNPDQWSLTSDSLQNWAYSFEENEGYDTDHDGISDYEELQGKFTSASEPQDADSPRRRQAMYFQGPENPSILQSMPYVKESHPKGHTIYSEEPLFLQYTVECWVRPDAESIAPGVYATILERAIWSSTSHLADEEFLRCNFQFAIRDGKWYTKFDSRGTLKDSYVEAFSATEAVPGAWTHLAVTYNGSALIFYINGVPEANLPSGLQPEYGVSAVSVKPQTHDYWFSKEYDQVALLIGGSFKTMADGVANGTALNILNGLGWDRYKNFFKGYVDEIRIWDGARSRDDINSAMRKRFTASDAKENREAFFTQWSQGYNRYQAATASKDSGVVPELRYHYSFDSVFGAENTNMVSRAPHGFGMQKGFSSRPQEGYEISWWNRVLNGYGAIYNDPAWVVWVPNTVAHLPRYDGTTWDSFYFSDNFMGATEGEYYFSHVAEPQALWTQVSYAGVKKDSAYKTTSTRHHIVNSYWSKDNPDATQKYVNKFEFTGRQARQSGNDLLSLGGAYVKMLGGDDAMWDNQGPSSNWEITGNDADNDGLPDWWEEYANENYRILPGEPIAWNTIVNYNGQHITAGEAYKYDLARGFYADASGTCVPGSAYMQRADDDYDGMWDWWEDLRGVQKFLKTDGEEDPDNDGLSNYQEFLIAHGDSPYGFTNVNPRVARSFDKQKVVDYFIGLPDDDGANGKYYGSGEYVGEVFTDHDFMEDWWENGFAQKYADSRVYDPWKDGDGDGWSNFAECRAYMWYGAYSADLIDMWASSKLTWKSYPRPAIGLNVSYYGNKDITGCGLIARTYTTSSKRADAEYFINPVGNVKETNTVVGAIYASGVKLHGFLHPGRIQSSGLVFKRLKSLSDCTYTWKVKGGATRTGSFDEYMAAKHENPNVIFDKTEPNWLDFCQAKSDGMGRIGELIYAGTNTESNVSLGQIDFMTGEYTLDMNQLAIAEPGISHSNNVVSAYYSSQIGNEWPQTVWLSDAANGRIIEGQNTIEVFLDIDGNGKYTVGEPYGMLSGVKVGWHKTSLLNVELTDYATCGDLRTSLEAQAGGEGQTTSTKTISLVRTLINGQPCERTMTTKEFVSDDRAYITEADVVTSTKPDLDWLWLTRDASKEALGEVTTASYEIREINGVSNTLISAFTRAFDTKRPTATTVEPRDSSPVYSASPTFTFKASEGAAAFEIQIATADKRVIYDSGVMILPARGSGEVAEQICSFTAPVYVNTSVTTNGAAILIDGSNYLWRVALFNSKYNTAVMNQHATSWASFQMDVSNQNRYPKNTTNYGKLDAVVRYYGPARTNDLSGAIIVEAFESADFMGQPLAQARVSSTNLLSSLYDILTTNATLIGIAKGDVYLRAFIDLNNNGKWNRYEPWGYANGIGSDSPTIYTPVPVNVDTTTADWLYPATTVIYIEDTDVNKNEIPDCVEDPSLFAQVVDQGEDSESTSWDTWAGFSREDDADYAINGDVMAYAEVSRRVITVWDGSSVDSSSNYILPPSAKTPNVGDSVTGLTVAVTYNYGKGYGLGTNVTLTSGYVYAIDNEATISLVHSQVYDEFGYDSTTATSAANAAHTKEFTVLDKYLVWAYLRAIGYTDKTEETVANWKAYTLKPCDIDNNRDGLADGWQLYVMFRGTNVATCTPWTTIGKAREKTPGGDGLTWIQEYDNGHYPTDPWAMDTDGDGVTDYYAYLYHLKGDDAGKDFDGDGLSNYAEYLITEVFKYAKCNPDVAKTNGGCVDYFKKIGSLYLGEIFTDHDKVGDTWEETYSTAANRYAYDPDRDDDEDGWSNYAEYRAGTDPTTKAYLGVGEYTKPEYPVPIVKASVIYNGQSIIKSPIVFQAWNEAADYGMTSAPDAIWTIGSGTETKTPSAGESTDTTSTLQDYSQFLGRRPASIKTYHLKGGTISPASVQISFLDPAFIRWSTNETSTIDASWYAGVTDSPVSDTAGVLNDFLGNEVGTVDYVTGLMTVDFAKMPLAAYGNLQRLVMSDESSGSVYDKIVLTNCYLLAEWKAKNVAISAAGTYYLSTPDTVPNAASQYSRGHVREGKTTFIAFVDSNGDGKYSVGELFGFARGVDVGWAGANFTVEVTETHPVFGRVDLETGNSDRAYYYGTEAGDWTNVVKGTKSSDRMNRVRVIRTLVDDMAITKEGEPIVKNRVLIDKWMDFGTRSYLTEADILGPDTFDLDWEYFPQEVLESPVISAYNKKKADEDNKDDQIKFERVTYRISLGNTDSNLVSVAFTRYFDLNDYRQVPTNLKCDAVFYDAQPVFRWQQPKVVSNGKQFNSYTAFRLRILKDGAEFYTTPMQHLPGMDADGNYVWAANFRIGDQLPNGRVLERAGNYTWQVASFNAKFRRDDSANCWSTPASFSTAVGQQQVTDDHNYHSVNVAVKYAGPEEVLGACDDLTSTEGIVRVQAFDNPDFAGDPAAQTFVTNKVKLIDTEDNTANVTLYGLAAGMYYIRAYIDSNGNFEKDDWESWGYATNMVSLAASKQPPTVGLYIEDADTDNDWLPDAWEYVNGGLEANKAFVDPDGKIVLKTTTYQSIVNGTANISTTLSGSSLTFFENLGAARLLLGNLTTGNSTETTLAEIRKAVEKKVVENTVKVTSLVVDAKNKQVKLMVEADVSDTIAGSLFSAVYDITSTVTVRVWNKKTIVEEWKTYTDYPVTITSALKSAITVSVSEGFDSGFYKVDVIQ